MLPLCECLGAFIYAACTPNASGRIFQTEGTKLRRDLAFT
jgi:hypothetical protein